VDKDPKPRLAEFPPYPNFKEVRFFVHALSIFDKELSLSPFWNRNKSSSYNLGKVMRFCSITVGDICENIRHKILKDFIFNRLLSISLKYIFCVRSGLVKTRPSTFFPRRW